MARAGGCRSATETNWEETGRLEGKLTRLIKAGHDGMVWINVVVRRDEVCDGERCLLD